MKLLLTSKSLEAKAILQEQKLQDIATILDKQEDSIKRDLLKNLSAILLNPDSFLINLPSKLAATLLICIFNFLEQNRKQPKFKTISLNNNGDSLLLINCRTNPYLVASIFALQHSHQYAFQLLAYPVLTIKRQQQKIISLKAGSAENDRELLLVIRLEAKSAALNEHKKLQQKLEKIINTSQVIDENQSQMINKLSSLKKIPGFVKYEAFIDWLQNDAFIFFAYQGYEPDNLVPLTRIGMQIDKDHHFFNNELPKILSRSNEIIVQTIAVESDVLRCERLIYIGFKETKKHGGWIEHAFLGLFNNIELNGAACKVAALCQKISEVLNELNISRDTHERTLLREMFNVFPKLELFLMGKTQLHLITRSLQRYCSFQEKVKLLILISTAPSRLSTIIIIPSLLYKAGIEKDLVNFICSELSCRHDYSRKIDLGGDFIGLQLTLITSEPHYQIDVNYLDKKLNKLARPWRIRFRQILQRSMGKVQSHELWHKYNSVFPVDYQALMPARYAIRDLLQIEQLLQTRKETINLLNPCQHIKNYRLHFYSLQQRYLDEYIQVLENLDLRILDQVQFTVFVDGEKVYIKSFTIQAAESQYSSFSALKDRLLDLVRRIFAKKTENDSLNSLLILTGLAWHEIEVLRSYRNYYMQLGYQTKISSFDRALKLNTEVAKCLFSYFEARFIPSPDWHDPVDREERALFPKRQKLSQAMEAITDINDDRILRTLFNLIDATVRTNYYVRRELDDFFVSIKINSLGIIDMPVPRPQHEIYVHAAYMEGLHLRGGKISRGGIRWSDRPDDFRTEILGLMQTQMSKNALIVPTGAKGGFVVKQPEPGQDFRAAGKQAYMTLIRGLLDLTDNYVDDQVIQLPGIVSYDDPDPYLVVAADKGTAQFPDIANTVAAEYHFWLADAFASGGSNGYNHKQLGITAKGAWECVKRHFRELGKNIQAEAFTVVGIGSMDGDVFGNGMLLSPYIQLKAAISGQHIFIDPDPVDVEKAFQERKRLFDLPGSSWADYDRELISQGGGVYRRDAKSIAISSEVKKWLKIRYRSLDAESLIRYLLCAQVDLLWFGGIGTYVKSSHESDGDAGDRANDNVRVDAINIQASVVGEGANLGFTQRGRVEYALSGGHINTDAIDNSAGVDISDHEVNLKIFLSGLKKQQIIDDYQPLFLEICSDVCDAVLANNYAQSLCLSLDSLRSEKNQDIFLHVADYLENLGLLDRQMEAFPHAKELKERQKAGLTRPELAVLMASSKIRLKQQILDQQSFIQSECLDNYLLDYFPRQVVYRFQKQLLKHPLAKEIKATVISSQIVNHAGCSFLHVGIDEENTVMIDAVSCYLSFEQILKADSVRQAVFSLDNQISTEQQYTLLMILENSLSELCHWQRHHQQQICPDLQAIKSLEEYYESYENYFSQYIDQTPKLSKQLADYQYKGIPNHLARRIIIISKLDDFPILVLVAMETNRDMAEILELFETTKVYLGLNELDQKLLALPQHDYWEKKITLELRGDFKQALADVVKKIMLEGKSCLDYFMHPDRKSRFEEFQEVLQQINDNEPTNLLPYIALNKLLQRLK